MNNLLNVQSLIESGPSKKVFYLRLSDFHKMTVTVKKVIFQKLDTKIILSEIIWNLTDTTGFVSGFGPAWLNGWVFI